MKRKRSAARTRRAKAVARPLQAIVTIETVRKGLPASAIDEVVAYIDVPQKELLAALRIPPSSYHRKAAARETLSSPETEKVVRLAEVARLAEEAFGSVQAARDWLTASNLALGATPLSLMDTDAGAREVRRVLALINYGGVA